MRFSVNLAEEFSSESIKAIGRDELIKRIGTRLGSIEEIIDYGQRFEGVKIVKVVACEKHPNADKLSVCEVDDGGVDQSVDRLENGLIRVVCGAPNVRAGMLAVWIAPGCTVPSSIDEEPFVIDSRELRGVISHGMLASMAELGLSDDHTGILDLSSEASTEDVKPGSKFAGLFGLDDLIVVCENKMFTHRPDCFGNLGIAREVVAITDRNFTSPDWYKTDIVFDQAKTLPLKVENDILELAPRFMAVAMSDVEVKSSPLWLQSVLSRVGIKSINNVIDITNYIMHLTGQPLHAFDYDKLRAISDDSGVVLSPRMSKEGEVIEVLGGKQVKLTGQEVVISSGGKPVSVAGVIGGLDTAVDEQTKNIVIECANFDMYSVRRTSMRLGLFTDSVTRFTKGQSVDQTVPVIAKAMELMSETAGARQASDVLDVKDESLVNRLRTVTASLDYINSRAGTDLSANEVKNILERAEFKVSVSDDQMLSVEVPFWRQDIKEPEDILEEVSRIYGFDNIEHNLPKRSASPSRKNQFFDFKYELRDELSRLGANEILAYSFVHKDLLGKVGIDAEASCYHLRNAISPDLQYYRPSLLPSLLSKVHQNIKIQAGKEDNIFALFEIGMAYQKGRLGEDGLPSATNNMSFLVTADGKTTSKMKLGSAFYHAKKYLEQIVNDELEYRDIDEDSIVAKPFVKGRSASVYIRGEKLGVVGEFKATAVKAMKLPVYTAGFELDLDILMAERGLSSYRPLPKFPPIKRDLTLAVGGDKSYQEAYRDLCSRLEDSISGYKNIKYSIEPVSIFAKEGDPEKSISFGLSFWSDESTLDSKQILEIMQAVE